MDVILKENIRLLKVQNDARVYCENTIDALINKVQEAKRLKQQGGDGPDLQELEKNTATTLEGLKHKHRELYQNVSKQGKALDKVFKMDLNTISQDESPFDKRPGIIDKQVAMHFLRNGKFAIAEEFIREAKVDITPEFKKQFKQLRDIVNELEEHQLNSAFHWVKQHQKELEKYGLKLEFELHKHKYLMYLYEGKTREACVYSTKHLSKYLKPTAITARSSTYQDATEGEPPTSEMEPHPYAAETRKLMGALVYAKRLADSPYKDLFTSHSWKLLIHQFSQAFCVLSGLPLNPPLAIISDAGVIALPVISKMSQLMRDKKADWSTQTELAAEIQLPDNLCFHSVFACPVSKEQSTELNPPMMLPCGHVICKESLEKLAGSARPSLSTGSRFKCPYCPGTSTVSDAKSVFF